MWGGAAMSALERASVAVIGCGLIGISWAALLRFHGHDVIAWDPSDAARENMAEAMEHPLAQLRELGGGQTATGRFSIAPTLQQAVRTAQIVQENGPERLEVKRALYRDIFAAAPTDAIISSSTSSLIWRDLAAEAGTDARRIVTAHPFNPPHLMPLVELFAADDAVRQRAAAFYRGLGREVVSLRKDAVGHIANRLASALWREAVHIVAEGIADVEDVDRALVHGPGLRWSVVGAHMGYHLGGGAGGMAHYLDHLGASQERRWASLGQPALTEAVKEKLIAGIGAETRGRSIQDLETARDAQLIAILKAKGGLDV